MVQYYFKVSDGPNLGPMGAEEFRQRQEAGEVEDGTMVWRSGMAAWSTYAALRAAELPGDTAASKASPPPLPIRKAQSTPAAPSPRAGFLACSACGLEWPEALLFTEGSRRICGNCQNRRKENAEKGRKRPGAGTSLTAWFFIAVAIISAGCLTYRITHPGPPASKSRTQELTAPMKYGK